MTTEQLQRMVTFEITPKMELVATADSIYKREGKTSWYRLADAGSMERVA